MLDILEKLNFPNTVWENNIIDINMVEQKRMEKMEEDWAAGLNTKPKLRTYKQFKSEFRPEKYILLNLDRKDRAYMAQLRLGILPIALETGRWAGIKENLRICKLCNSGKVENETNLLFVCPLSV